MADMACWLPAVGQLAAHSALVQGAEKVAIVDSVAYRMDYVKKWLPEVHTIDFSKVQVGCQPSGGKTLAWCGNPKGFRALRAYSWGHDRRGLPRAGVLVSRSAAHARVLPALR